MNSRFTYHKPQWFWRMMTKLGFPKELCGTREMEILPKIGDEEWQQMWKEANQSIEERKSLTSSSEKSVVQNAQTFTTKPSLTVIESDTIKVDEMQKTVKSPQMNMNLFVDGKLIGTASELEVKVKMKTKTSQTFLRLNTAGFPLSFRDVVIKTGSEMQQRDTRAKG